MRRPNKFGLISFTVIFAFSGLSGCAGTTTGEKPPAPRAAQPMAPPVVSPAPPPPVAPQPPPIPPTSIGPRPAEPPPTPPPPVRIEPVPPPPKAPPPAPAAAAQRGRFVVLNFDNADIETVVHAASEIVGFNYVLAPDVRGKVTVQTSGRIPQEDVFGVLLAILEVHGFTAVKSENLYKIVRLEGARERAVPTVIGLEPDPARAGDEVVTQIIPVRYSSVADLGTLLRPLISARGTLIAHRETSILIITDSASNVRRVLDIIKLVDVEVALDELQIIQIRFADAADMATILTQLFASGRLRRAPTAPGAGPSPAPPPVAPTPPGAPRPPTQPPAAGGETVGGDRVPLIIAERRSNSLIVHARKPELETIRKLIQQLDTNIYGGRRVFIYYAENAKAKDLAATLNSIYGGRDSGSTSSTSTSPSGAPRRAGDPLPPPPPPPSFPGGAGGGPVPPPIGDLGVLESQIRFIADETTNSVIVTTFPRNWQEIEVTIKQLDRMPRQVLVEVLVTEITLSDNLRLGVDWAIKAGRFTIANQAISSTSPTITPIVRDLPITSALGLPGAGLTAFTFATDAFMALLNTLAAEGRINVLSNPHVMTTENKKAVINVSDSVPIVTSQQVPIGGTTQSVTGTTTTQSIVGTQSVEYRDAGVVLTVTPRIGEQGTVALDVKQEVNEIGNPEPPTGSPRIFKREAETSVVLVNNQTLVLGGLITERRDITNRGVPFFKDIPIFGYLFGAKISTTSRKELLILITPRVLGTAVDAARVTEEIRRSQPVIEDTIQQRTPRPPTLVQPPPTGATPPPPPAPPPTAP